MLIRGTVTSRRGSPVQGVLVTAFDKDLRSVQELGETARTNASGRYEISYTREAFRRAEKSSADVFIEVRDRTGGNTARSEVTYNAPLEVTIDLVVAEAFFADAEFTRLAREVTRLAAPDKVAIEDLEETEKNSDVAFLAAELAVTADRVQHLIVAHRLQKASRITGEFFYALLRGNALVSFSPERLHAARFAVDLGSDTEVLLQEVVLLPADSVKLSVDAAIRDHIVERGLQKKLPDIRRRLTGLRPKAQKADSERARGAVVDLLGRALEGEALQKLAAVLANDHLGHVPLFIDQAQQALSARSAEVSGETRAALELAQELATAGPLTEPVKQYLGVKDEADLCRLASLDEDDWRGTLQAAAVAGAYGRGAPEEAKRAREAQRLAADFARRYPSAAFALRLAKAAPSKEGGRAAPRLPQADLLAAVVTEHPDLDLRTVNVGGFMRERKIAEGEPAEHRAAIASALRSAQRLYRLAPSHAHAAVLLEEGLPTAKAASGLTRGAFVARVVGKGGITKAEAERIHARAQQIHTGAVLLAGELRALGGSLDARAMRAHISSATIAGWKADFPNLKTLFDVQDMCECLDCRSVYGPAAYVADALQFLKERRVIDTTGAGAPPSTAAKDALFARRPDLGDIDLNCDNALTPIPYIDVVNELLEELVAPDPGFAFTGAVAAGVASAALVQAVEAKGLPVGEEPLVSGPDAAGNFVLRAKDGVYRLTPTGGGFTVRRTRQTHGTAEERAAAPEYVNDAAYLALATKRIAFALPFDAAQREVAAIFAKLDLSRADLMRAVAEAGSPSHLAIAAEEIGLSRRIADIIVAITDATQAAQDELWNTGTGLAVTTLEKVSTFLDRTGLAYKELETLLEQPFVNPGNALFVQHLDFSCDTAQKKIAGLDLPALDRMHRFLRLWRATRLTQAETNHAIRFDPAGTGVLDPVAFVRLGHVFRLARRTARPVGELLWLYGPGPDGWDPEVYRRIFANPANGASSAALAQAVVTANEAKPAAARTLLATSTGPVALALGRTPAEIDVLRALLPDDELTFLNLGRLYGLSAVARLAKLAISSFVALRRLSGINAISGPSDTWTFLDVAEALSAASVDPIAATRLLSTPAADPDPRIPNDAAVTSFLQKLQAALVAARLATRATFSGTNPVENAPLLLDLLARLGDLGPEAIAKVEILTRGRWNDTEMPNAFLDRVFGPVFPLAVVTGVKTAWAAIGVNPDTKLAERNAFILALGAAASDLLYDRARRTEALNAVTSGLKLDETLALVLLERAHLKAVPAVAALPLGDVLTDPALITLTLGALPAVTKAAFPNAYAALKLVAVMGIAAVLLRLDRRRAAWLLDNAAAGGFVQPDALPHETGMTAAPFAPFLAWIRARRLDDVYPPADDARAPGSLVSVLDVIALARSGTATVAEVQVPLAIVTGWEAVALAGLTTQFAVTATQYGDPVVLIRLETSLAILKRIGVGVAEGLLLVKELLTPTDVAVGRAALRARYEPADWLTVRKAIEGSLRERRRDALIAYLTATDARFSSALDLFDFLLINVEMSSCQPTSRIVQAHGTIQMFVERCLMGIEPATVADTAGDTGWARWDWMRNYRVWEANRRVFLYPENWIEPELRDDKSPFFQDLEKALKQTELTDRSAEDALQAYMQQLDEVAFLEHLACYYDTLTGTLHVFARTKGGDPATYYYRRFYKEREWTAWEKVDLDITADQLVPFMRNRRLYLAWPVFEQEAEPRTSGEPVPLQGGGTSPPPNKRLKIKLALSEYNRGVWLQKKLSKDGLVTDEYVPAPPSPDIFRFISVDLDTAGFSIVVTEHRDGADLYFGAFSVTGCKGYPEPVNLLSRPKFFFVFLPRFKDTLVRGNRPVEQGADATNDFALQYLPTSAMDQLLANTPDGNAGVPSSAVSGIAAATFKVAHPQQMTALDKLIFLVMMLYRGQSLSVSDSWRMSIPVPLGTLLPFFFEDRNRVYSVVPGWYGEVPDVANAPDKDIAFTASDFIPIFENLLERLIFHYAATIGAGSGTAAFIQALQGDADFIGDIEKLVAMWQYQFGYRVDNAFHPLVCSLRRTLNEKGVRGLLSRQPQLATTGFDFSLAGAYGPTSRVITPRPVEDIDFRRKGAYAGYNWELFFHVPFLMAVKLSAEQRFEEAMRWFHYIFDPTGSQGGTAPQKYWVTAPFYTRQASDYAAQRIDSILYAIAQDPSGLTLGTLADAVEDWRDRPFRPHVIARSRSVAYQKSVLMKYIGNLIGWGDSLFRQETMESINRADQLYVLAEKLLGPKPRLVPPAVKTPDRNYNELEPELDLFLNALVDMENLVPDPGMLPHAGAELPPAPATLTSLYFCIPPNDKMLEYWTTVADRRFKIAHCRTIDGAERTLALFAPRIDPADLVRAVAQGLSISAVLAGLGAPVPPYRFNVVAQKAVELIQEVRTLGQELGQALEKRDAEALALLRSTLEMELLDKITEMKQAQIREAQEQRKALDRSVDAANTRRAYYQSRAPMSDLEATALVLQGMSGVSQAVSCALSAAAGVVNLIPNFNIGISGFGGSPQVTVTWGSSNIAGGLSSFAGAAGSMAGVFGTAGSMVATVASYERRKEEWQFQTNLAGKDIAQLNQQIVVAGIREDITARDLAGHRKQIDNAKRTDAFMRSKFTNRELFDWMAGEVTTVYFQAYDLAFTMAKKAERCYQHELGTSDTFIQGGSWDSVRKGLGSANRLMHQVRRMETAYLDRNRRDYELVRNVSLALLDPVALVKLKLEGKCTVTIPEALFDLDHAGHYMRRVKAVSLTVPCVAGPYTAVSCKLTLLANRYRRDPTSTPPYEEDAGQDARFVYNVGGIQSIATSQSQNDSGMFELNFRDERYLPFEGCGAVSTWQIEFGSKFRTFDPMTIADIVLQLRYTAREGGSGLRTRVESELIVLLNKIQNAIQASPGMLRCIDLRHELPDAWHRLTTSLTASFEVTSDMLPYFTAHQTPLVSDAWLLVKVKGNPAAFVFDLGGAARTANKDALVIGLCSTKLPNPLEVVLDTPFTLASGKADDLEEGYLLVRCQVA